MEKNYILKSRLQFTSKDDKAKVIKVEIKLDSNHQLDSGIIERIEKYFITDADIINYEKELKK